MRAADWLGVTVTPAALGLDSKASSTASVKSIVSTCAARECLGVFRTVCWSPEPRTSRTPSLCSVDITAEKASLLNRI